MLEPKKLCCNQCFHNFPHKKEEQSLFFFFITMSRSEVNYFVSLHNKDNFFTLTGQFISVEKADPMRLQDNLPRQK